MQSTIQKRAFLDMNSVNTINNNLLGNSAKERVNHKRYLKQLPIENIDNIVFARPKSRREAEMICSKASHTKAIESYGNAPDEFNELVYEASLLRKDILKNQS